MMIIVGRNLINDFCESDKNAADAMLRWLRITQEAAWKNLHDIKQSFNATDYVGNNRYVFDIRGNKYRIIAAIEFNTQVVRIRFVGTHKDYDKIDASII
jgi:mRNA interferase HigB